MAANGIWNDGRSADTVVGREGELTALNEFLAGVESGPSAVLVEGEAGIGKTTLCEAAVAVARGLAYRVLACRPSPNDMPLSFAALGDLLEPVRPATLDRLPAPQRRALEVALLLQEANGPPPNQRAIAVALLGVLRSLASAGPVLVAVDDAQWLDAETALALEFAVRRLVDDPIGLLVAHRPEGARLADDLGRLPEGRVRRLNLGPLSVGALHRMLGTRLGVGLPRPTLLRVHEVSGGNPFYALEIARALLPFERLVPGEPLPVPVTLTELLLARVRSLPESVQRLLVVVSLLAEPTLDVLDAAEADRSGAAARLEPAIANGVLGSDGRRVWFTHPLLGETVLASASPRRRQQVHAKLASVVVDGEQRARHLALATIGPDPAVALALERAAGDAAARGAPASAAELAELAIERTPVDASDDRQRRALAAGQYYLTSGGWARGRALLTELAEELPAGGMRADVLLALAEKGGHDIRTSIDLAERALRDATGDPRRLARIETRLGVFVTPHGSRPAFAHARRAVAYAERSGDAALVGLCLARLALWETCAARPTPGLLERAIALDQQEFDGSAYDKPQTVLAVLRTYQGRLDDARALLQEELAGRTAHADEQGCVEILGRLAEAEWHAGAWPEASEHAAAACELAEQIGPEGRWRGVAGARVVKAFIDAHRGEPAEARALAEAGIARAEQQGVTTMELVYSAVLGLLELIAGNISAADSHLRPLLDWNVESGWALATAQGPPLTSYALEMLIAVGELDRARPLVEQFEEEGNRVDSPWVGGVAGRLRASLCAAQGNTQAALDLLEDTLAIPESHGWPFERARTLLALGTFQRRTRQKRAARDSLTAAVTILEDLGAVPWVEKARIELGRISGRAPGSGELTPTERRIAELVAEGQTNREVAARLFVTPRTIEWNLTRIYAKLGVRSRTQLSRRLPSASRMDR